jgi:hypothetical protein
MTRSCRETAHLRTERGARPAARDHPRRLPGPNSAQTHDAQHYHQDGFPDYIPDTAVPCKAVGPGDLQVSINASLLKEAGWFDLVVKNPRPLNRDNGQLWGNGKSNKAHLIINYCY